MRIRRLLVMGSVLGGAVLGGCGGGGGASAPIAPAAPRYTAVMIGGIPAGYKIGLISGMNSSGTVTGAISKDGGAADGVPFTWSQAKGVQLLKLPASWPYGWGASINDSGMVVGTGEPVGPSRGLVWDSAGNWKDVGDLGGASTQLFSINNSGEAVGLTLDASDQFHQISWSSGSGIQDLSPALGPNAHVSAIGDSGVITGYFSSGTKNSSAEAFAYSPSGGFSSLGFFTGYSSLPQAVNKAGTVAGGANCTNGNQVGFVWNATTGSQVLGKGPAAARGQTGATGINSSGAVVGGAFSAYIWTAKDGLKLLTPITQDLSGVTLTSALAINDSGEIACQGSDANFYLLKPITPSK